MDLLRQSQYLGTFDLPLKVSPNIELPGRNRPIGLFEQPLPARAEQLVIYVNWNEGCAFN